LISHADAVRKTERADAAGNEESEKCFSDEDMWRVHQLAASNTA